MGGVFSTTKPQPETVDSPNGNGNCNENGGIISCCGTSYDYYMEMNKSTKRYNAYGLHVIVKPDADIIDMAFLGLDKFTPPKHRFKDQDVENKFCSLLRKSGGRYWPSNIHYFESTVVDPTIAEPGDGLQWFFAWPDIEEHPSARNLSSYEVNPGGEEFIEENGVWAL
ncbi:hypothetical protein MGYG_00023 [Nannizzia gypsea CBS 118893]|uniref:Uncharacterized protein n=1 Tax=Arthroderma gypseum (strain ATCC MYA-4604 / CBS 118893) TaxID=535722 RepID=E5R289_ARTGP|nr:hypothetical protein MGYG_00023 [Nannizzia gypsea CBS 118893]EFQ96979.1 hypothetical protein MGYG_00023 [Nannizzia gypsea CBS 118893]